MSARIQNSVGSLIVLMRRLFVVTIMVHLLALSAVWLVGRPVQAAPSVSPNPAPTEDNRTSSPVATPESSTQPPTAMPESTPVPVTEAQPVPMIAVGADVVNVRTGPGTNYTRVGHLEPGAQAKAIGRYGDWWQIEYGGAPAWVAGWVVAASNVDGLPQVQAPAPPTPVPVNPEIILAPAAPGEVNEESWIDVDLSEQLLTAYEGGTPVHTTLVSTGLPATPTPVGQFHIWIKLRYDDMEGAGYYIEDVPFVMYFYKGYGLHGVTWHGNFGHPMSHGCVNLPTAEAEWLFNWADVGTLVNIHD